MKLSDIERVMELREFLRQADDVLKAFQNAPGDTVPTFARSEAVDFGRVRAQTVALLPVPKAIAVSAALRVREKLVASLSEFGVETDPPRAMPPTSMRPTHQDDHDGA